MITTQQKERLSSYSFPQLMDEFHSACRYGDYHTVRYLIATPVDKFLQLLPFTFKHIYLNNHKKALTHKKNFNKGFLFACQYGHFNIVEYLLKNNTININDNDIYINNLLKNTIQKNHFDILFYLLNSFFKKKEKTSLYLSYALSHAYNMDKIDLIEALFHQYKKLLLISHITDPSLTKILHYFQLKEKLTLYDTVNYRKTKI